MRKMLFGIAALFALSVAAIAQPYGPGPVSPPCTAFGTTSTTCAPGNISPSSVASGATGTTATAGDSTTKLATTAFVNTPYAYFQAALTSGTQSISSGVVTKIALNTASIDSAGGFVSGSNWYVIPKAGTYRVMAQALLTQTSVALNEANILINKNAGTVIATATSTPPIGTSAQASPTINGLFVFAASDTVELDAFIQGSSALVSSSAANTWLSIQWVGP